jgi:hypothetical protein
MYNGKGEWRSSLRLRHKMGGTGFSSDLFLLSDRNEYQVISMEGKVRPKLTAKNSAVLIVPNVKVMMEAQQFIPPLSLHDLLLE